MAAIAAENEVLGETTVKHKTKEEEEEEEERKEEATNGSSRRVNVLANDLCATGKAALFAAAAARAGRTQGAQRRRTGFSFAHLFCFIFFRSAPKIVCLSLPPTTLASFNSPTFLFFSPTQFPAFTLRACSWRKSTYVRLSATTAGGEVHQL